MKLTRPLIVALGLLLGVAHAAAAQATGRIAGRVVSAETGEAVPAAQVVVIGSNVRATTGASGAFLLNGVPAGPSTMVVQAPGYGVKTVTGVAVPAGSTAEVNVTLEAQVVALEGITVTASGERSRTNTLLLQRRKAATVVDAIGADQIARAADGDAAAALKRIPGVSVVDGKYVYVRGLGDRYGNTTLNGAPLPSPIPDKKAVPLDIVPAGLLESVVTAKTYSPDQPGDYAGGLVQIETRTAPTRRVLKLSSSVGYNTATTFRSGLGSGAAFGLLGLGGPDRGLPLGVPVDQRAQLPRDDDARRRFANELLAVPFGPVRADIPLNQSYSVAFGDEYLVGERPVGLIGTLTYSDSYSRPANSTERFFALGGDGLPARQVDYTGDGSSHESALGGLLSASVRINDTDRITASGVYNRLSEEEGRVLSGLYESQGPFVRTTRLEYVENTVASGQLRGEHLLETLSNLALRWRGAYSRASRYEPGTRTAVFSAAQENDPLLFQNSASSGTLFHQDMNEDAWNAAADLKLPLRWRGEQATLSFGASADLRDRGVFARRLRLIPNALPDSVRMLQPEQLFVPERIGFGRGQFALQEATFGADNYNADQRVSAGYVMANLAVAPRLRLLAGARVERADIRVRSRDLFATGLEPLPAAVLDNTDVLPAANLTYTLTDAMNLRAAVSRTVARPQLRELAPYLYADYFGGLLVVGNPLLERTGIVNADLRWEYFFGTGALASVGVFRKDFDRPVEPVALILGSAPAITYANSDRAVVYGTELEFRTNLGHLLPALQNVSANANLTVVRSDVNADSVTLFDFSRNGPLRIAATDNDRPLFGQSPVVANVELTYFSPGTGTTASVLYNYFGERLDAFGGAGLPNVLEKGRGQLDLTVQQPLGRGLSLRVAAIRLTGTDVEFFQLFPNGDRKVTRSYDVGRTFSFALSWEPAGR